MGIGAYWFFYCVMAIVLSVEAGQSKNGIEHVLNGLLSANSGP